MAGVPRFVQLRRVPPGVWAVLAWVVAAANTAWQSRMAYLSGQVPDRVPALSGPAFGPVPVVPDGYRAVGPATHLLIFSGATLAVLLGGALLRRFPMPALTLLLLGGSAGSLVLHSTLAVVLDFLPADIALWYLADRGPRRTSVAALATACGVWAAHVIAGRMLVDYGAFGMLPGNGPLTDYFDMAAVVALAGTVFWLAGISGRQARAFAASRAAEAATAERLRLSRDLHDSVAHDIGIIAVLAGAAARVLDARPEAAREALTGIETTSRDTLSGLQRMLRTLRNEEPYADPGLLDVERLAARASGAGVHVELSWSGERRTLPPEIDRSAYRIIQEAVTNVVRHSGTTACRVAVGFEADALAIEVTDEGPDMTVRGVGTGTRADVAGAGTRADTAAGPGARLRGAVSDAQARAVLAPHGGFGLLGMRERVAMLSGQFSAGPRPEGGFRVAARLPA